MLNAHDTDLPIGVFDSGMGGLTVLAALQRVMPRETFVFLGDTARLPYGTKSADTVRRYAVRAATHLVDLGIKALVVACNTASAAALAQLKAEFAPLPVFGVIEPGALAASLAAKGGSVAILATEGTVREGAYNRELLKLGVQHVYARPAPLLVTLAEEGRSEGSLARHIVADYLDGLGGASAPATLLLGCTHFPVFKTLCAQVLGDGVQIVDSASTTAAVVAARTPACQNPQVGMHRYLATDGADRFRRVGRFFLGRPLPGVELVDL